MEVYFPCGLWKLNCIYWVVLCILRNKGANFGLYLVDFNSFKLVYPKTSSCSHRITSTIFIFIQSYISYRNGSSILHSIPGENPAAGVVLGVEQAAPEHFLLEDDRTCSLHRPQRILCTKFVVVEWRLFSAAVGAEVLSLPSRAKELNGKREFSVDCSIKANLWFILNFFCEKKIREKGKFVHRKPTLPSGKVIRFCDRIFGSYFFLIQNIYL